MRTPPWWYAPRGAAALALAPLGAAYGALTAARMARPGASLPVPVLCVGNLVAGGAGKTPTAIAVAGLLRAAGRRPAILSRGYGRRGGTGAVIAVDPALHRADVVGDEPLLLAAAAPTFVAADRGRAGRAAVAAGADILLLDDGLQSPALAKDAAIAVVDGAVGIGNGLCVPAGPLRAPVARQWPAVTLVCVVGEGTAGEAVAAAAVAAGKPVVTARLTLDQSAVAACQGRRLLAFAGIGRPDKFFESLRAAGLDPVATRSFPDHHAFAPEDLATLKRDAEARGATLVTTTKDAARLPPDFPARALPATLRFTEAETVERLLASLRRQGLHGWT